MKVVIIGGVAAGLSAASQIKHGFFYFKMGLYRDLMKAPMTIYLDDFRKDQIAASDWMAKFRKVLINPSQISNL